MVYSKQKRERDAKRLTSNFGSDFLKAVDEFNETIVMIPHHRREQFQD